ncbi:ribonuclease P protein component, partial [Acinetobacter baumannii]|nr:ribonuclease P protein component [Acinetobacter baumannii]
MAIYSFSTDHRKLCAADYKNVYKGTLFKVHQPQF